MARRSRDAPSAAIAASTISALERAPGIHVADRALAEEGGAAARRLHRDRRLGGRDARGSRSRRIARRRRALPAPAPARRAWSSGPTSALPRAFTASIAACSAVGDGRAVRRFRQALAEAHEQRAVERAGAPPTFMTSCMPAAFSASGSGFAASCVEIGKHRLEAALHVGAVVAVADRAVERGELVGMVDDRARATASIRSRGVAPASSVAWPPPPIAVARLHRNRAARRSSTVTASPAASSAAGSTSVTSLCSPTLTCRWFWSPRCSIQSTVAWLLPFVALAMRKCSVRAPIGLACRRARRRPEAARPERG